MIELGASKLPRLRKMSEKGRFTPKHAESALGDLLWRVNPIVSSLHKLNRISEEQRLILKTQVARIADHLNVISMGHQDAVGSSSHDGVRLPDDFSRDLAAVCDFLGNQLKTFQVEKP